VPGAPGTWKDLTGKRQLLAANLTSQVRAIAEVRPPSPRRSHPLDPGRCARRSRRSSKDNINTMIGNLRLTTDVNTEQDWLKTNLAKFYQHAAGPARLRPGPAASDRVDAAG